MPATVWTPRKTIHGLRDLENAETIEKNLRKLDNSIQHNEGAPEILRRAKTSFEQIVESTKYSTENQTGMPAYESKVNVGHVTERAAWKIWSSMTRKINDDLISSEIPSSPEKKQKGCCHTRKSSSVSLEFSANSNSESSSEDSVNEPTYSKSKKARACCGAKEMTDSSDISSLSRSSISKTYKTVNGRRQQTKERKCCRPSNKLSLTETFTHRVTASGRNVTSFHVLSENDAPTIPLIFSSTTISETSNSQIAI